MKETSDYTGGNQGYQNIDNVFEKAGEGKIISTGMDAPKTLERKLNNSQTGPQTAAEGTYSTISGLSPEELKENLDKIEKEERENREREQNAEKSFSDTEKRVCEALKVRPNAITATVYNLLEKVGVDMYSRRLGKKVDGLKKKIGRVENGINEVISCLEGKVDYYAKIDGQSEETIKARRKSVREADKGLKYGLAEETDKARAVGELYRGCIHALARYRVEVDRLNEDLTKLESDGNDPSIIAKISLLTARRNSVLADKEKTKNVKEDCEVKLSKYDGKIDSLKAAINLDNAVIGKGRKKIQQIESDIYVLENYIRNKKGLQGISGLVRELESLEEEQERIDVGIEEFDRSVKEDFEKIKEAVERGERENSERQLMKDLERESKEQSVATEKDMGRILSKLGIPI